MSYFENRYVLGHDGKFVACLDDDASVLTPPHSHEKNGQLGRVDRWNERIGRGDRFSFLNS